MKQIKKRMMLILISILLTCSLMADEVSPLAQFTISPNPMERLTLITLTFTQKVNVIITIEDSEYNTIKTLFIGERNPGTYQFVWDRMLETGIDAPNGKYYVNVSYELRYTSTKKTLILK